MYLSRWAKFKFLRRVASYCTNIPEFKKWPLTKKVPFESHRLKKKLNIKKFSTPRRTLNSSEDSQNVKIYPMAIVKISDSAQNLLVMPLNQQGFDASTSSQGKNQSIFKDSLNLVVENTTDIMNIMQCLTMLDLKTNSINFNEESIDIKEIVKDEKIVKKNKVQNKPKTEESKTIEKTNIDNSDKIDDNFQNFNKVERVEKQDVPIKIKNFPKKIENVYVEPDYSKNDNIKAQNNQNTEKLKTQQNVKSDNIVTDNITTESVKIDNFQSETYTISQPRAPPILMQSNQIKPMTVHREETVPVNPLPLPVPSLLPSPLRSPPPSSLDIPKVAPKELEKVTEKPNQLTDFNVPSIKDMQLKLVLDLPDLKEIAKMQKENRPENLLVNFNVHFTGVANLKLEDVEKALKNSNDINQMSSSLATKICSLALKNFIAANNQKKPAVKENKKVFTTDCNIKDTEYSIAIKNTPPKEESPK